MQTLKKAQTLLFQRMIEFQRGTMESELAFVTSQIAKFIFKDVFVILVFVFPLQGETQSVHNFFAITQNLNLAITISLSLFLSSLLLMGITRHAIFQQRFKFIIRLFVPWLDIFSLLTITVNIQLLKINLQRNIALIAFNILAIVSISIIQIFYNLFHFTKEPRSNNLFKKRESQVVSFCNMITLVVVYYLSATFFPSQSLSLTQSITFSFIQLLTSLLKIKQRVYLQYYLSPFSQSVSSLFYFIQLYLSLLVVVIYVFNFELVGQNLIFLLMLMTLLSYSALNAYLTRRNSCMYLSNSSQLKDEDQAILYLDRLCELITKVQNEEEDIILVSLRKKHSLTCKNADCYCQVPDCPLGKFVRQYIRMELFSVAQLFHNSPSILISILYFRMVLFKYYPQVLAKLNYYATHFNLSLTQRYYRYCLTQYVSRFIRKKNYEIDAIDSEHTFQLENLRVEIQGIIRGEIEVRSKKWKYLSRGLCRVSELQHNCNISLNHIARLMQIFQQNKVTFKKSKEFNLLFLFYFIKVSFLNNGKQIRQNLKQLYFGYKEDELYTLKQFKKFIYHKRSCVIETVVDTKNMGIVSAASRNVQEMFGFPPNKVIGLSINSLMPQFMAEEHEIILSEWAKSGTWRTIGKLKEIYCIHKEQYCFSALLYLKIYIKDNTMHFITNIFKLNENDYLVINPTMKIQGLGRKFLKLFGDPAKKMPLDLLIQHNNSILDQETYVQGKVYRKIFLSLKSQQDEVDRYLENINMKFDENQRKKINNDFHEKLQAQCQQKYFVQFSIKRYKMRSISFIVIGIKEAKKIDKQQSIKFLQRHPTFLQNAKQNDLIEYDMAESRQSSMGKDQDNDEVLIQHNANSSLTSMSEKENYPLSKTIDKFIGYIEDPSTIKDTRLANFNIIMVILLILLSIIDFASFYAYREVLLEIENIFFADGAQSDIMQTTEIGYSYIYMLKSQLTNTTNAEFASTLESARLVNSYVYSLRQADFASLFTSVTSLTKDRLYAYIEKQTVWTIKAQGQQLEHQHLVLTHQFLENMYYLTTRVINDLQALKAQNSTNINAAYFESLFTNFPQMKFLNQFFLDEYQLMSDNQHSLLSYITMVSLVLYFLLSLVLAITLNHYFRFRFDQLIHSFTFFAFIPGHYYEKMRDYYGLLISTVVERDKLKAIDVNEDQVFDIETYDLFHKNDNGKGGLTSKIKFTNYQSYYKWLFILMAFILANGINYYATSQIRNFLPASQTVIGQISDLMRSENKILEAYFDLRAAYSLNASKYFNQQLYDHLVSSLNETDGRFNNYANSLTSIFRQYDPLFEQNFVYTLITNVCTITAPYLTQFQIDKCKNDLKLNILDGGILISMNFFHKNMMQALEDLRQQQILKTDTYQGDYFRQTSFVQLDKMLIYMFKIYQQTQAVTYNAYILAIDNIVSKYLRLTIGMTAFFILVMLVWLKSISAQKKSLSYLYGHLLLVPFMILKSNTRIVSSLKDSIQYSDN